MRVQNPRGLAEVLLAEDKGWSSGEVGNLLATGYNTEVQLARAVPVHVTYFTAMASSDGHVQYYPDIYGLDGATTSALEGKPVRLSVPQEADTDTLAEQQSTTSHPTGGLNDLFSILLGF